MLSEEVTAWEANNNGLLHGGQCVPLMRMVAFSNEE
jgi:hypothetical protein